MNKSAKRRLVVVGGIVVIAMLVIVAIAGSGGSASSLSIADVLGGNYDGKKVQVSGAVVADSLTSEGSAAVFKIAPEGVDAAGTVDGKTLEASEMVTKCPSKYESAEGSLTVKGLLDQQDSMMFKDTKVCGYVTGEINDAQADFRFTIESQGETLKVAYDGGLDEVITDGTALVISGHLDSDGVFVATEQPSIDSATKA